MIRPADPLGAVVRAWHFVGTARRLGYGDGREVRGGETYRHAGPLVLCESGLHAAVSPLDALQYAPGPIVCRVECGGAVIHGDDKFVCSERRVLWVADGTETLRRFARLCALDVLHLWAAPEVVERYLRTGDESQRVAAARDAARAAAWDAARAAAMATAMDAAMDAAMAPAIDAAMAPAIDAQRRRLHRLLLALGRAS